MATYQTTQLAELFGIHPNTVRLYEDLGLIPKARRLPNGYRCFTDFHRDQMELVRTALQVEVLQNGLRKRAMEVVKTSARGELAQALELTEKWLQAIDREQIHAQEAIESTRELLGQQVMECGNPLRRKEVAELLGISMDTLRGWEMNGLLTVKRRQNGYRVYTQTDLLRLKIIRSLRCANYSLSAILRLLGALSRQADVEFATVIDTPGEEEPIISVCDRLLTSLESAKKNAQHIQELLKQMQRRYSG